MKSVIYKKYGASYVLKIEEVVLPDLLANQVLVRVCAASLNPYDWHLMRGTPYLVRTQSGLFKPKNIHFGVDMAGVVEKVGESVSGINVGDEVFGGSRYGVSEYVVTSQENITQKPESLSFDEAAAIPMAGYTALQAVRDKGKVEPGQKVLIVGASGGVGTLAVQIVKAFGAEVTGVCSTRNMELVKSLGADQVIDYTKEDFWNSNERYDVIIQTAGNYRLSQFRRALKSKGILVVAGDSSGTKGQFGFGLIAEMLQTSIISKISRQKLGGMLARRNKTDLNLLKELVDDGKLKPVIDSRYSMSEIKRAIEHVETGHAQGKVIISI